MQSKRSKTSRGQPASALRALVALNAALLVLLAVVTFAPAADAQGRRRGTFTMVGGVSVSGLGISTYGVTWKGSDQNSRTPVR